MFGANASPYMQPGDWQIHLSSRNLVSDDHYNGTAEQHERQERQNYITNRQNLFDVGVTRALTRRVSVSIGVPFVYSAWAFRNPASPLPGPRIEEPQWGRGLGDITVTSRTWLFHPGTHPDWNVAAGAGLKFPTGNSAYQDRFIDVRGALPGIQGNPVPGFEPREVLQYVDQSVQPGDGGWGIVFEGQAFWRVKKLFLFASGSYLANPQDTNDTPSILEILGVPTGPGTPNEGLGVNSIPDQYLARVGGTVGLGRGFNASLAWRMEGLKRYDLFGASHGWRRPGTTMFVEPGISYTQGVHSISFNVPIGFYYNRHANPYTGRPGDATFPRHIFLTSYSVRLGRRAAATPPASDQPPPSGLPVGGTSNEASAAANSPTAARLPEMAARTICPTF